jgi:hypothetical protein
MKWTPELEAAYETARDTSLFDFDRRVLKNDTPKVSDEEIDALKTHIAELKAAEATPLEIFRQLTETESHTWAVVNQQPQWDKIIETEKAIRQVTEWVADGLERDPDGLLRVQFKSQVIEGDDKTTIQAHERLSSALSLNPNVYERGYDFALNVGIRIGRFLKEEIVDCIVADSTREVPELGAPLIEAREYNSLLGGG